MIKHFLSYTCMLSLPVRTFQLSEIVELKKSNERLSIDGVTAAVGVARDAEEGNDVAVCNAYIYMRVWCKCTCVVAMHSSFAIVL